MSHIDTLQAYEDLIATGVPENQAKAQVHALDKAFDGIDAVKKIELDYIINSSTAGIMYEIALLKKDFNHQRWITLGIGALVALPVLEQFLKFGIELIK